MKRQDIERHGRTFYGWLRTNYVVRNIVLALSLIIILAVAISILLNIFTRHDTHRPVPDFKGYSIEDARQLANDAGLRLEIGDSIYMSNFPAGAVIEQNPRAGSQVKSGRHVFVIVNSSARKQAKVPYVVGYSLRQAVKVIESHNFEVAFIEYVPDIATNNVLGERIGERNVTASYDMKAIIGSGVTLSVGRSNTATDIPTPRLVGLTLAQAKSRLWGEGLNVGEIDRDEGINMLNMHTARVYQQSARVGSYSHLGAMVDLAVTLDSARLAKAVAVADKIPIAQLLPEVVDTAYVEN